MYACGKNRAFESSRGGFETRFCGCTDANQIELVVCYPMEGDGEIGRSEEWLLYANAPPEYGSASR